MDVETTTARRRDHRFRLWQRIRGIIHGVAVLTYGWQWEIYDLSIRARSLDQKLVARLVLDPGANDSPQIVAHGLNRWIARDQWW